MRPRGSAGRLAAAAMCLVVLSSVMAAADSATPPFQSARVVLGLGAGAMHVDLPDPYAPGTTFGTRPRVHFDLGIEARPWLELGAELGYAFLAQSDSLNSAIAAQGLTGPAVRTHLQATGNVRARWLRDGSRWAPYARAGAGVAALYTQKIGPFGGTTTDPAWDAGLGLEFYAQRHILLRAEGLYVGESADGDVANHAAVTLSILYALHRAQLGEGE